ncbi:Para-aminobenzoate synthase, aminase component [hydrothermal vent metagenome]|uniref:Para-aminobenzoate synthase, aminase component n=1 Tax=hydrothermal vent metagenome TaxID=652676 RepID=A0A3B0UE11_9ZZZZ
MEKVEKNFYDNMDYWGGQHKPFVFLIDFECKEPLLFSFEDSKRNLLWQTPFHSNFLKGEPTTKIEVWEIEPAPFQIYKAGFNLIQKHIQKGDTFLLNYTQPCKIKTNLSLEEIFYLSSAPYKILLKDRFTCFSPEIFVRIEEGKISSFPMKGTIEATAKNAEELILKDTKEIAEHNTIADLIRNDLSMVADNVKVEKFRYLDEIKTNRKRLLQVSSKITGELPGGYCNNIGAIISKMLPAGSISGAPKPKTLEVIRKAENYPRGYYTGIFGYFDGKNLDSCVLIRYIENQNGQLVYKSGGGITFMSDCETEYNEMINKVYVPIT